jgi:type IV secretory pathway VirB4 component
MLIEYSFLNNRTTLDFNNGLIVFSLSGLDAKMSNIMFEFLIEKIMNKIRHSTGKSVIYIDEVWKFIYNNICSAEHIFTLFKTIRKLDAGIVTITQDVSDFLSKDLGIYGKSIINNSFIKVFFKMEYSDSELLSKIGILNLNEVNEITRLNKGSMIMLFQSNIINLDVKSNEYEDKIIRGDKT